MGESQKQGFQLSFNLFLRVDFQGSRVTSDGRGAPKAKAVRQHVENGRGIAPAERVTRQKVQWI